MPPPTEAQLAAREDWVIDWLDRRMDVVDGLVTRGGADPLGWLGLQRQVRTFTRQAATVPRARSSARVVAALDDHVADLATAGARADAELAAAGPAAAAEARSRLGIRLALIGKGGAGKTVTSSTLARLLARRGRKVLAVDLDVNPGLAISLGLPPTEAGLPPGAIEEATSAPYGWQLAAGLSPEEAVERHAAVAPDGVRFLGLGKIGTADKEVARRSVAAVRQILLGFSDPEWDVIADLEAGPTTPFEGYHDFSDHVLMVVGPAWRSAMTARRLLPMVDDRRLTVVYNRFRDEADHPGLPPDIRIPNDPELTQAEREGRAPVDACPDSPAIRAVEQLADLILSGG
ncbi:MAG: AAA family ATPase [Actinomycetota bacterium]|nr:AAA family ATPase [Actinomycetota bacterium]